MKWSSKPQSKNQSDGQKSLSVSLTTELNPLCQHHMDNRGILKTVNFSHVLSIRHGWSLRQDLSRLLPFPICMGRSIKLTQVGNLFQYESGWLYSCSVYIFASSCYQHIFVWICTQELHIFYGFLRGNCTPNQKLACFVLYLKIINTFLKNNICIL